jgi:signal transduction histidine kinase
MSAGLIWGLGSALLVLTVAGTGWALRRFSLRSRQAKAEALSMLEIGFRLQRKLLEAADAQAVVRAAMQAGMDLLGAGGVSFLPFDEWRPNFTPLSLGAVPVDLAGNWSDRLRQPPVRQECKLCQKRAAGSECVLLSGTRGQSAVWCTPLRQAGREIGILNFYFDRPRVFAELQHFFLAEMAPVVDAALESLRRRQDAFEPDEKKPLHQAILDERARLAREIHDGLAQTLAFLKMEASRMQSFLEQGETERLAQSFQGYARTLADAYLDARQAIDDLRRQPDIDLADWLERAAADFEAVTGTPVEVHLDLENSSFPMQVNAQLTRIIQEALTNVRKHSRAAQVAVRLSRSGAGILLEVQDNGCGFTPVLGLPASQYGLRGMRERAESIGADFQVISQLGGGTTVQVRLPALQEAS